MDSRLFNKFYGLIGSISVGAPDYEKMTLSDIEQIADVWESIKEHSPDIIKIESSEHSDYRSWEWNIYKLNDELSKGIVRYTDKNTGVESDLEVYYVEDYYDIHCLLLKTGFTFSVKRDKLIKKL